MTLIPKYNAMQVSRTGERAVHQAANASAAHFGGNTARQIQEVGGALEQTGRAVQSFMEVWQERIDRATVRDQLNQIATEARDHMAMIQNLKGEDADTAYEQTKKWVEQQRQRASEGLQTETQRQLFQSNFDRKAEGMLNRSHSHADREMRNWEIQTLQAQNLNAIEDGVQALLEDGSFEEMSEAFQTIAANTASEMQGMGREITRKETRDRLRQAVVQGFEAVQHDADLSREYLKRYGDLLPQRVQTQLRQQAKEMESRQKAHQIADEIAGSGKTLSEQFARANNIKDMELRGVVLSEIRARDAQRRAADAEAERQNTAALWEEFDETNAVPTHAPLRIQNQMHRELEQAARRTMAEPETFNPEVLDVMYALMEDNPQEFMSADLREVRGLLPRKYYEKFVRSQESMKNDRVNAAVQRGMIRAPGYWRDFADDVGSDERKFFEMMLRDNVMEFFQTNNNQVPNDEQMGEILRTLSAPATTHVGWIRDTKEPQFLSEMNMTEGVPELPAHLQEVDPKLIERRPRHQYMNDKGETVTLRHTIAVQSVGADKTPMIKVYDMWGNLIVEYPDERRIAEMEERERRKGEGTRQVSQRGVLQKRNDLLDDVWADDERSTLSKVVTSVLMRMLD